MGDETVGVDIAKLHFDVHSYPGGGCGRFQNTDKGRRSFLKWLKSRQSVMVVFEPTGPYHKALEPVRRFYRETGIRNLDLYIAEDTRAMLALAVVGLPTTILIDRIGRERGRLAGPAEWNSPEAVAQISALIDERKQ
ncbi:hypothetical protein [Paracoccus sp. T5]